MSVSSATDSTTSSAASSSAIAQTGTAALAGLSTNFSTFLTMLMTQLKNQDPTSPLDSSQFTTQLVQFSSVEQQINTNTNLTSLIALTQASQVEQSSSMLGKTATVTSAKLALQDSTSKINFNTPTAEPVTISVFNAAGAQIQGATLTTAAGTNSWKWDGKDASGVTQPDGAYTVTVTAVGVPAATAKVPFTVTGTVTGVQNNSGVVDLQMGGLLVPFSSIQSVGS
jgi:flagellar basal-body rod modification protein FlgD